MRRVSRCAPSSTTARGTTEPLPPRPEALRQAARNLQDREGVGSVPHAGAGRYCWSVPTSARGGLPALTAGRERTRLGLVPGLAARRAPQAQLAFVEEAEGKHHVDDEES